MGPHTHTLAGRRGGSPDASSPPAHAPAAAPGSSPPAGPPSAAASPRCCRASPPPVGQEQRQSRSQRPRPDGTRAMTRGLGQQGWQAGHALCGPLAPGSRGARPHARSRSLRGFACDTWVTEGAGDRLVRGDVLPPPRAPHPRPLRPLLGLRVASQRGQQAAASAGRARHTFYLPKLGGKFEQFSLLSGRASGRQKVRL